MDESGEHDQAHLAELDRLVAYQNVQQYVQLLKHQNIIHKA